MTWRIEIISHVTLARYTCPGILKDLQSVYYKCFADDIIKLLEVVVETRNPAAVVSAVVEVDPCLDEDEDDLTHLPWHHQDSAY